MCKNCAFRAELKEKVMLQVEVASSILQKLFRAERNLRWELFSIQRSNDLWKVFNGELLSTSQSACSFEPTDQFWHCSQAFQLSAACSCVSVWKFCCRILNVPKFLAPSLGHSMTQSIKTKYSKSFLTCSSGRVRSRQLQTPGSEFFETMPPPSRWALFEVQGLVRAPRVPLLQTSTSIDTQPSVYCTNVWTPEKDVTCCTVQTDANQVKKRVSLHRRMCFREDRAWCLHKLHVT